MSFICQDMPWAYTKENKDYVFMSFCQKKEIKISNTECHANCDQA